MTAKSWQTTMAGLTSALGVILSVVLPILGVQLAEGKVDELAGAFAFLFGLLWLGLAARDDGVSSEGRRAPKCRLWILLLLAPALVSVPACTHQRVGGVRDVEPTGYRSEGAVSNALVIDRDGQTTQEYAAEPPAAVIANAGGVENYSAVPFGQVSALLPGGTTLVASVPNDFGAERVKLQLADGQLVDMEGVSISTSQVVMARAEFLTQMLPIVATWTEAQKQALIAELEAQAAAGDAFIQGVLPILRAFIMGG